MPRQPANSRCSTPSHSEYWAARKRTVAWATVSSTVACPGGFGGVVPPGASRTVSDIGVPLRGESGIYGLVGPGAPHPSLLRMVGDPPGPLRTGPGHHVQVVHVVTRGRRGGPVPAVRHQDRVPVADLLAQVDLVAGRGRGAEQAQTPLAVRAGRDLEVVDLLEHRLGLALLVVLVRRVGRPVAA